MAKWLLLISLTFCSTVANAQWFEAKGRAFIYNDNAKLARSQAMENALKKALLVAGASVSSVRQVINGLITQDELNIRASGIVHSFEVVDETYVDNTISVTIRADIFPQDKQCFSADYRKSVLITRSHILHREQANIGGIYDLDKIAMEKFAQRLNNDGNYVDTRIATKSKNNFSRLNRSLQSEAIKQLTMSLAEKTDSQFILFSELQDISIDKNSADKWNIFTSPIYNRQFQIEVFVYQGSNGELIFNKQYQNLAPWPYPSSEQVDINTVSFWNNTYGNAMQLTFDSIITDIDEAMMCHATQATVVHVANNEVTLNLGRKNGVKIGDEFSLLHLDNFTNQNGKTYAGYNVSDFTVKVTQVSEDSARATTESGELFDNIQINDRAVRH